MVGTETLGRSFGRWDEREAACGCVVRAANWEGARRLELFSQGAGSSAVRGPRGRVRVYCAQREDRHERLMSTAVAGAPRATLKG